MLSSLSDGLFLQMVYFIVIKVIVNFVVVVVAVVVVVFVFVVIVSAIFK